MKLRDQAHLMTLALQSLRSQWWSAQRIRETQERALVRIMRHAVANVPFYENLGVPARDINSAADLLRFPLINKRDIQKSPQAFLARGVERSNLQASRTSGSSGQPTTTYFDRSAWLLGKYALKMRRIAATSGISLGRRVMIVSEQTPQQLAAQTGAAISGLRSLFQQRYLSIHTPAADHLPVLGHYNPHILYAFPSYLLDLIATAESLGVALPRVAALYTSSEVLTAAARERIEAAFAAPVYDVYGSTEFKEVAWQCRAHSYHLNFESVYAETLAPGARGALVLSSLCNFAMPLLRFDIGDRALFGPERCACGRESLALSGFEGREGDMITLPSGRRVSPYVLTTAIESEESIIQYRIHQTAPLTFRLDVVVTAPGVSQRWRDRVGAEFDRLLDPGVCFDVREVSRLDRDPSGKRSAFVRTPPPPV
ncbi:MAG: hypothetical protein M3N50_02240 [Pseudomonadota bacterium]|nr:hypothetical protein [Pseudomonadota bacterium]